MSDSTKILADYANQCGVGCWEMEPLREDNKLSPHAIVIAVAGTKEEIDIALDAARKIEELQKQRKASEN